MFRKQVYVPALLGCSLAVGFSGALHAQSVETRGSMNTFVSWESNPEKRTSNQRANSVFNWQPTVEMSVTDDVWNIDGRLGATLTRSKNRAVQADTKGYNLTVNGERLLETGVIKGNVLSSITEFANSEFDEAAALAGTEASNANEDDTITRNNAALIHDLDVNEQLRLTTDARLNQTEFSDAARQDFLDARTSLRARYAIDEVMTATGRVEYQRFMPDGLEDSNVIRLSGGVEMFFEEGNSLVIEPGVIRTDSTIAPTASVTWAQIYELFTVSANASLDHEPDDQGNLDRRSREQAVFTFLVTPQTNAILTLSAEQNETVNVMSAKGVLRHDYSEFLRLTANSAVSSSDRQDQGVVSGQANWTLTENLAMDFLLQQSVTDAATADKLAWSTKGQMGLTWKLP